MTNKQQIKGNVNEFVGKLKQKWAMIGDNDYALYAEGKKDELLGKIQKATGNTKEAVEKEFAQIEKDCGCAYYDDKAA